jgi:hypothetical protein
MSTHSTSLSPEPEFASLRADYAAIDALLARPAAQLARVTSSISGWSAEQQIAHLALANELVCRNLHSLLAGAGALVVPGGEPEPRVLALLAGGRFPRGAAQAPRMVRPPERIQRELLEEWIATGRSGFESLAREPAALAAARLRIPHQILGPLDAAQWLRFAAMHTRHHLEIARELLAAQPASS